MDPDFWIHFMFLLITGKAPQRAVIIPGSCVSQSEEQLLVNDRNKAETKAHQQSWADPVCRAEAGFMFQDAYFEMKTSSFIYINRKSLLVATQL